MWSWGSCSLAVVSQGHGQGRLGQGPLVFPTAFSFFTFPLRGNQLSRQESHSACAHVWHGTLSVAFWKQGLIREAVLIPPHHFQSDLRGPRSPSSCPWSGWKGDMAFSPWQPFSDVGKQGRGLPRDSLAHDLHVSCGAKVVSALGTDKVPSVLSSCSKGLLGRGVALVGPLEPCQLRVLGALSLGNELPCRGQAGGGQRDMLVTCTGAGCC